MVNHEIRTTTAIPTNNDSWPVLAGEIPDLISESQVKEMRDLPKPHPM